MTLRAALLPSVFIVLGCDSASVYEDCREGKEFSGEERCLPSTFPQEHKLGRESVGFVSYGVERQTNALVTLDGQAATTDTGGFYRFRFAPFRYDISARLEHDVVTFRGVAHRFLDLAVERDVPMKAYTAKVLLSVANAPRDAGHRLAFFVGGDEMVGLTGSLTDGFVLASRRYTNDKAKLHVVEYPVSVGLTGAVAKGSVDLVVRSGQTQSARVELTPVLERKKSKLTTKPPAGFVPADVELFLHFGTRFGEATAATVKLDEEFELPIMENANWLARVTATRSDGASASVPRLPFSPGNSIDVPLFDAPDAVRNDGDVLVVSNPAGQGVLEHTLVPLAGGGGGKTIHLFSALDRARVPDLASLGLPTARGAYRWSVRLFPDFVNVEAMSGVDNRLYRSSSTSSARTIELP